VDSMIDFDCALRHFESGAVVMAMMCSEWVTRC
jgi:hypothetical protein